MKAINLVTDEERELKLSTTHSASSYGVPVLVDVESGEAIDAFSFAFYQLTEASAVELEQLREAGYAV